MARKTPSGGKRRTRRSPGSGKGLGGDVPPIDGIPETPSEEPATTPQDDGNPSSEAYKVGFGKPPVEHQFKPGRSGNPRGRPKGAKSLMAALRDTLMDPRSIRKGKRKKNVPAFVAAVEVALRDALAGNNAALRSLVSLLPMIGEPKPDDPAETPLGREEAHRQLKEYLGRFGIQLPDQEPSEQEDSDKPSDEGDRP